MGKRKFDIGDTVYYRHRKKIVKSFIVRIIGSYSHGYLIYDVIHNIGMRTFTTRNIKSIRMVLTEKCSKELAGSYTLAISKPVIFYSHGFTN